MRRKEKLNLIKSVRAIRDEMLTCENNGRLRKLLLDMPNIYSVSFRDYGMSYSAEIRMDTGHEYRMNDSDCLRKLGILAYFEWIKRL